MEIPNLPLFRMISLILLIVGGINAGIYGLIGADLLSSIMGGFLSRLLHIAIGAAAGLFIYLLYTKKENL